MQYSPSTGGFYPAAVPYAAGVIPADAVATTPALQSQWYAAAPGSTLQVIGGALTIVPPPGETLADAQAAQIAALNAAYQAAIVAPVAYATAAGTLATFPQTAQAKAYLAQCLETGAAAWTLNLWLDVNGHPVSPFAFADLEGLAAAMEAAEVPEYQDLLAKIADVQSATTIAAVQEITF